jgi:hypothetical protein
MTFGSDGTSSLPISCGFLSDPCKGKATVTPLPPHRGRAATYPRRHLCGRIAVGHYSVQPGASGKAKLELTKFGEKALGRGGKRSHCRMPGAREGRVQYPRCSTRCFRVVVTTKDTRTGGKSRQKVLLRGGRCAHCKRVVSPRPAHRRSLRAPAPTPGTYQGCPKGVTTTAGHCEGEGFFTLQGNKLKPANGTTTILAPTDFSCNAGAIPKPRSIPVSGGSFDYHGPAANQKGVTLRFKGGLDRREDAEGIYAGHYRLLRQRQAQMGDEGAASGVR